MDFKEKEMRKEAGSTYSMYILYCCNIVVVEKEKKTKKKEEHAGIIQTQVTNIIILNLVIVSCLG